MAVVRGTPGNDIVNALNPGDILQGLAGNDVLNGTTGSEQLNGGSGADTMNGGSGKDFYDVDNTGDIINDSDDDSIVNTTVSFNLSTKVSGFVATNGGPGLTLNLRSGGITGTGTVGNDVLIDYVGGNNLIGNAGSDVLKGGDDSIVKGGAGNDNLEITGSSGNGRLIGGAGDDTYYIYSTSGNLFIDEYTDDASGTDTVFTTVDFSLANQSGVTFSGGSLLENLTLAAPGASFGLVQGPLFGEGNNINNVIIGNRQDNTLNGLGGNDSIYGSFGDDSIDGGSGNDQLFGQDGNDTLIGGSGSDALSGGINDDTYYIDGSDTVAEVSLEGTDTVYVNGSWTSNAEVEYIYITTTSSSDITLSNTVGTEVVGNQFSNQIVGGSGNDLLKGGASIDTLTGGAGNDVFAFGGTGLSATGSTTTSIRQDTITDFLSGTDKIQLDKTNSFSSVVDANDFVSGNFGTNNTGMGASSARIVYNTFNGSLYYNENGSLAGAGNGGFFATLTGTPILTAADFIIV